MSRQNTRKPHPPISPIITRIQTQASTSTVQPVEIQTTVPITPILEQVKKRPDIIFVSPTRAPLTLK